MTLVAIFGTTISPYLFFWQAAQAVEVDRVAGKVTTAQRMGATPEELRAARTDVVTGMFFSNFIMYFIILTTGATLHAHGQTDIGTAVQAAQALKPLAGNSASLLFAFGLIGTGLLGVPVLAGSVAYAVAEAGGWQMGMDEKPLHAKEFYAVLGDRHARGDGDGLRAARRDQDALLGGGAERRARAAAHRDHPHRVQQPPVMMEHVNGCWLNILGGITALVMSVGGGGDDLDLLPLTGRRACGK